MNMPADLSIPVDLEAEKSVLGAVLLKPTIFNEVASVLSPLDFQQPAHGSIFAAMAALERSGIPIDVVSMADQLKKMGAFLSLEGGTAYLPAMAAAVSQAENVNHYVRIVKEKAIRRRLLDLAAKLAVQAEGSGDVDELLMDARDKLAEIQLAGFSDGPKHVQQIVYDTVSVIEDRTANPHRHGVRTGIENFDVRTGGLGAGWLITLGGQPSMGKTAAMMQIAQHAATVNVPTLVFSLEMPRNDLVERMLAKLERIPASDLRHGRIQGHGPALTRGMNRVGQMAMHIDDRPLRLAQVIAEARRWHARECAGKPMGLVCVDYLQLLRVEDRMEQTEEIPRVTRALKLLAKELRLPVVLLSQISKESYKREGPPTLADLKGSGSIEADSDMVIFPYRKIDRLTPNRPGPAQWIIEKNKYGPIGGIEVWFDPEFAAFDNVGQQEMAA